MSDRDTRLATTDGQRADIARTGFGSSELATVNETQAVAVAERAKAEVQARYIMAIQRPRDWDEARVRILAHCQRPRFAATARYSIPRGGRNIEGASIRFVEAALQAWGNVVPETLVTYDDSEKRILRVQMTDLEANVTYAKDVVIEKVIERKSPSGRDVVGQRKNSRGEVTYLVRATDDEIAMKQAMMESKAIRTLGLRILPPDVVDEAMDLCVESARKDDAKDPSLARKKLADAFAGIGVKPAALSEYLAHDLEQTTPGELEELRAVYIAIKDGEANWRDAMAHKRAERGEVESLDAKPKKPTKGQAALKVALSKAKAAKAPAVIDADAVEVEAPTPALACADCGVPIDTGTKCGACANGGTK